MRAATRFGWWLLAAALALFCYWPSLTTEFGVHNDYSVCADSYDRSNCMFGHSESAHLVAIGRPLGAVLLSLHFYPIHAISDFTIARWFTFFVILLSAWLLARGFERREHLPRSLAVCAAACVFMLPSSQVFVYWVSNFVPGSLNVLLSLLTYEILDKVEPDVWRDGSWRRAKVMMRLAFAGLMLLSSMCIYPATALFVLVPTFCSLVFSPLDLWRQTRRRLLRDMVFVFVVACGYYLLTRCVIQPGLGKNFPTIGHVIARTQGGLYQLSIEHNLFVWLDNFWKVLSVALNGCLHPLLSDSAVRNVAWVLTAGLALAAAWRFLRKPTGSTAITPSIHRGRFLQACLAGLALLALAECPVIAPAGTSGFVPYRVVYPSSAMIVMLLFSIVRRWRLPHLGARWACFAAPLPALILLGYALVGHLNLEHGVGDATNELVYCREQLHRLDLRTLKALQVIGPADRTFFIDAPLRREFSLHATSGDCVYGFIGALLAESGISARNIAVRRIGFDPTAEYSMGIADTTTIDMSLATWGAQTRLPQRPSATVSASRVVGAASALGVFDSDAQSFWEAQGMPQWVQIDYGRPYLLAEYSLRADQVPERTPMAWQLFGSNDETPWTLVDQQTAQLNWAMFEMRTFTPAKPVHFCRYKLVVTSTQSDLVRLGELRLSHENSARVVSRTIAAPH